MKAKIVTGGLLACLVTTSGLVTAQEEIIEEIVVTGSFIKRDKYDMASPVETIDPETILSAGQTTIGGLVRNLPYTQNVDTVANVLGAQDGGQDSNGARFNLRGLGNSSTLTLMDGRRAVDPDSIASILPELAIGNIDIVLDGGAATYGTDAVAGVVNFVPLQQYDGFKIRGFYTQDAEGDTSEPKVSLLWGKSWEKFDLVTALDYSERKDPLRRSDRPKYLRADNDSSVFGNPGTFAPYVPGNPSNIFGSLRDPACGTFNGSNTDDGLQGSFPSGFPGLTAGFIRNCTFEYGEFQDYKRPNDYLVFYTSANYNVNDNVALKAIVNWAERTSTLISSPSTGEGGSNTLLRIDGTAGPNPHPNNPFGATNVEPLTSFWRPFAGTPGATAPNPSHDSYGAYAPLFTYTTYQINLGSEFDIGDTGWYGEVWAVTGNKNSHAEGANLNLDRLQQSLRGEGGVNGNQWFNPFGSSSSLAVNYGDCEVGTVGVGGGVDASGNICSRNAQDLVDWMWVPADEDFLQEDYWSLEGFVSGDIFELPAGPVSMAVGAQIRYRDYLDVPIAQQSTIASVEFPTAGPNGTPAGQDYNTAPANGVGEDTYGESEVRAVFSEFIIPLLDTLEMNVAVRYEDFTDFGLSTTVPKVSFRWEAIEDLVFRLSWGEGFLAPTIREATVVSNPGCGELFAGTDSLTGSGLAGALSCFNGNPNLEPESSTIFNYGVTWRATDDLELSLDYQTIEYNDRIVTLGAQDIVNSDYGNFLAAGFVNTDPAQVTAWINGPDSDPRIIRDAGGSVVQVTTGADNVNDMEIEVVDFRVLYSMDLGDWGYVSTRLTSTFYPSYEYQDATTGRFIDGSGKQNGQTNVAPPLPKYKNVLSLGWLLENHSVAFSINNSGSVDFDASTGPAVGTGPDPVTAADTPKQINAYTTVDFRYAYKFEDLWGGSLDLGIGSNNATNNLPQALPVLGGLETRLQDPIGRTYYIEGTYSFE
jgi:outer membrane receptor protein involved in Fe transport